MTDKMEKLEARSLKEYIPIDCFDLSNALFELNTLKEGFDVIQKFERINSHYPIVESFQLKYKDKIIYDIGGRDIVFNIAKLEGYIKGLIMGLKINIKK